jgi:hypothetical protein
MKEQPPRHTEKQLMEEKNKEKNRQLHKQHKELIELRNASEIKTNKNGVFFKGGMNTFL